MTRIATKFADFEEEHLSGCTFPKYIATISVAYMVYYYAMGLANAGIERFTESPRIFISLSYLDKNSVFLAIILLCF